MNFIEIAIRRDQEILHKEVAQVPDAFVPELIETYKAYYPDAVGDTQLFQRICRGIIEGVMANIQAMRAPPPIVPPPAQPMQFQLESEAEPQPAPLPETGTIVPA